MPPMDAALDAFAPALSAEIDARAAALEPKLTAWRRDLHENPELGDAEHRTSALVAEHLRALGLEVRTGVARTGVVGVLRGGRPGPTVALRADMDGLPVREEADLPFASKATGSYLGATVPVMHACGHDAHTAILMTVAELLAGLKHQLPGTVVFLFQPSEEGPSTFEPDGERFWGARQMIEEGALDDPKVEAVFGLHVIARWTAGKLLWRSGPTMASADTLRIKVCGCQTHGAMPWAGVDPIVVGAQVVMGLQTIASRQMDVTKQPTIVTIGKFQGGVRHNIIPDAVDMAGTIRTYDEGMRRDVHTRVDRTARFIAESAGASAEVKIVPWYGPTVNHAALTTQMAPTLKRVAGEGNWDDQCQKLTGAEDFSFFQERAPGLFFFLGITPRGEERTGAPNHSPRFFIDESALPTGVRALAHLAVDYLSAAEG